MIGHPMRISNLQTKEPNIEYEKFIVILKIDCYKVILNSLRLVFK